jgi:hypothetical protein
MTDKKTISIAIGGVVLIVVAFLALVGEVDYPDTDTREINRDQLFLTTERLLEESEAWPAELSDGTVEVSSSLDVYPVRTVRYAFDVDTDFESVVALLKDENFSGKERRYKDDKYEETLFQRDNADGPYEWVRRSVHMAPPPGGNRDAVVMYFEDSPDPKTYRIAFQSVETIEGKGFPEVEGAVRFKVLPSMYKVQELAPGKVRIRKVEAVDPRGAMSTRLNNHIISLVFFRNYMFEQAKAMRDTLAAPQG